MSRNVLGSTILATGALAFILNTLAILGVPPGLLAGVPCLAVLFAAVIIALRLSTTQSETFILAGGSVPSAMAGIAISASASMLLLLPALRAVSGDTSALVMVLAAILLGLVISAVWMAPAVHASEEQTLPAFLGFQYQSSLVQLLAAIAVAATCCAMVGLPVAMAGAVLVPVTQLSAEIVLAAILASAAMLAITGGMSAILTAGSAAMALLGMGLVLALSFDIQAPEATGGIIASLLAFGPTTDHGIGTTTATRLATGIGLVLGVAILPCLITPALTTRSAASSGRALLKAAAWSVVATTLVLLGGRNDVAPASLLLGNAPVVGGLLAAGVLAACISVTALLLQIAGSAIGRDGYAALRDQNAPLSRTLFASRISVLCIVCATYWWLRTPADPTSTALPSVPAFGSHWSDMLASIGFVTASLFPVMYRPLRESGKSSAGAVAAILLGALLFAYHVASDRWLPASFAAPWTGLGLTDVAAGLICAGFGSAAMFVVARLAPSRRRSARA